MSARFSDDRVPVFGPSPSPIGIPLADRCSTLHGALNDEHTSHPLHEHHSWKAKPGFKIFLADRGAARFSIPQDWILRRTDDCLRFYDAAPPDDEATIGFTLMRVAPVHVPATELLTQASTDSELDVISRGDVIEVTRPGHSIAWRETRLRDVSGQHAISRMLIGKRDDVCVLVTFDFWVDDLSRVSVVWDEVLASLELGRYVTDPRRGDVYN